MKQQIEVKLGSGVTVKFPAHINGNLVTEEIEAVEIFMVGMNLPFLFQQEQLRQLIDVLTFALDQVQ